jgi:hypothetical protein
MAKIKLELDALKVESFATDAAGVGDGTVYAHDSEGCKQLTPGAVHATQKASCFVASCHGGSCFDCSIQLSCWQCKSPICPPIPAETGEHFTFADGCGKF